MPSCPEELRPLLSAISNGSLVLTPNHLTSVQLHEWYGQWRHSNKLRPVCLSPKIYPVDIWIRRMCSDLLEAGNPALPAVTLLTPAEESVIWYEVVSHSDTGAGLLNPSATAKAAQETWTLVHLWQIGDRELEACASGMTGPGHDDLAAFLEWMRLFRQYCRKRKLVTQVELLHQLVSIVKQDTMQLPDKVFLLGFSNPPPLYQALLDALEQVRASQHLDIPDRHPVIHVQPCEDASAEIQAAAQWARQISLSDEQASIGIIITDLHNRQAQVKRLFSRCFSPEETRHLSPFSGHPFTLSAGRSLGSLPLVRFALMALRRNNMATETLETCQFLRSPFLVGAQNEASARASLEQFLRDRNQPRVSNTDLKKLGGMQERAFYCPALVSALESFDAIPRPASGRPRTTREWRELFEAQLAALGWPGERHLAAEEIAVQEHWHDVLETFYRMAPVFGQLSLDAAIALLARLADNHACRATGDDSRIRILTPLEADGLHFTHCRMLGLSEQQWPPTPRLSPFIPYSLQKARKIPETDMQQYTEIMQQVLSSLAARTEQEMVFSYPALRDDIPLKPARMLFILTGQQPATEEPVATRYGHPLAEPMTATATELLEDDNRLPLVDTGRIRGGTALLSDQAECPFRSFARHRLKARPLEKLVYGLAPRTSGNLVHLALELLWKELSSQEALLAMAATELESLVARIVKAAVNSIRQSHFHTMTDNFCVLEEARLNELLLQWLEEERKRGSFTVLASELKAHWQHDELSLSLRIDRIDQDENGRLVLVDYKTSRSTRVDWEDERPANSQLMLYALAADRMREGGSKELEQAGTVNGVYFAQVNIENTRYAGLSDEPGVYPGSSVEELRGQWRGLSEMAAWHDLRQSWQQSLSLLVDEFLNGCVAITPKSRQCCDHCFIRPVCRIDEGMGQ